MTELPVCHPSLPPSALGALLVGFHEEPHPPFVAIPAFSEQHGDPPIPAIWIEDIHPDGIRYYRLTTIPFVTHINPRLVNNSDRLLQVSDHLQGIIPLNLQDRRVAIVLSSTQVRFNNGLADYYLVDYDHKRLFWVNGDDPIGFMPYHDQAYRDSVLEVHFWKHVHHFPALAALHIDVDHEVRRLLNVLSSGVLGLGNGHLPWPPQQCDQLYNMVKASRNSPRGYQVADLGNLNHILAKHRHEWTWDRIGRLINRTPRRLARGWRVAEVPVRFDIPAGIFDFGWLFGGGQPFPWWTSRLASFSIISLYLSWQGVSLLRAGSVDPRFAVNMLGVFATIVFCPNLFGNRIPQNAGLRLILAQNPKLAMYLRLVASLDLTWYSLFLSNVTSNVDHLSLQNSLALILIAVLIHAALE